MVTIEEITGIQNCEIFQYLQYGGFNKDDITFPKTKTIWYSNLRTLSSGDMKIRIEDKRINDLFLIPRLMQFGDYDDSCMVERSNKKVFLRNHSESPIVFETSGGYGSEGIALSLRELLNPDNEETAISIIETLNALNDYPCIDDELMSNMEYEAFIEALEDCGIEDTCRELAKKYSISVDDYDRDKLKELILEIDRRGNPVYEIESGGICYIHIEDMIVPKITRDQFISVLKDYEVVS